MCNRIEETNFCKCDAQLSVLCSIAPDKDLNCKGEIVSRYARRPGAKNGDKCSGFINPTDQATGKFVCVACPREGKWFSGKSGDTCRGTQRHSGNPYEGILDCGRR